MKPTSAEINQIIVERGGILNITEVIGYIHSGNFNSPIDVLVVKLRGKNEPYYYIRYGNEINFRICYPNSILISELEGAYRTLNGTNLEYMLSCPQDKI